MCEFSPLKLELDAPDDLSRHPVQNDYLPPTVREEMFMREPDDMSNKVWDENALVKWETECNDGRPWSGRPAASPLRQRS